MHRIYGFSAALRQLRERRHRCQHPRVNRRPKHRPQHDVKSRPRARRQPFIDQLSVEQRDGLPIDGLERQMPEAWQQQRIALHVVADARRRLQRGLEVRRAGVLHRLRKRDRLGLYLGRRIGDVNQRAGSR
jgi:hypothetical protein